MTYRTVVTHITTKDRKPSQHTSSGSLVAPSSCLLATLPGRQRIGKRNIARVHVQKESIVAAGKGSVRPPQHNKEIPKENRRRADALIMDPVTGQPFALHNILQLSQFGSTAKGAPLRRQQSKTKRSKAQTHQIPPSMPGIRAKRQPLLFPCKSYS